MESHKNTLKPRELHEEEERSGPKGEDPNKEEGQYEVETVEGQDIRTIDNIDLDTENYGEGDKIG